MEEKVQEFKDQWSQLYGYISLELNDDEIMDFIHRFPKMETALSMASDYLLANGLADVME